VKVYRNGDQEKVINTLTSFSRFNVSLLIGGSTGNFFNGLIDDISICNRALTDAEIKQLYNE
jgi:hypothetical protein